MADQRDRLGSSGVFKAIVAGARKFTRAVTGGKQELSEDALAMAQRIAQAFIAGRFADVHEMGTPALKQGSTRDQFVASWREAVKDHIPFTGFDIANAGDIDLTYIPGLEDVPQSEFCAFVEIVFSSPDIAFDSPVAFLLGVVLLDQRGTLRVGAIHTQ